MKLSQALVLVGFMLGTGVFGFVPYRAHTPLQRSSFHDRGVYQLAVASHPSEILTEEVIRRMGYRALQRECKSRGLPAIGSTDALKASLLESANTPASSGSSPNSHPAPPPISTLEPSKNTDGIKITAERSPESGGDPAATLGAVLRLSSEGQWKSSVRKLRQLTKCHEVNGLPPPPAEAYESVLGACSLRNLHDNYATPAARKVIEQMVLAGHPLPPTLDNLVVTAVTRNRLADVDSALAIMQAMADSNTPIAVDTYYAVIRALSDDKSIEEALLLLRAVIVEESATPSLDLISEVAVAAVADSQPDAVLQTLSLTKASGYELDTIGATSAGLNLLSSGLIASAQVDNTALGLRLLTAAGKVETKPDNGDKIVVQSSSKALQAALVTHSKAITTAVQEKNWKLATRVLDLMIARGLYPNNNTWMKVLQLCVKAEKSRTSVRILFSWILSRGDKEPPSLKAFNSVLNSCEECGETELTLAVLDKMREIHGTDGNVITFNIALKRLAKSGNPAACEGIIIGMLESRIEPSVVSFSTAIAACASAEPAQPATAAEWLRRMEMRRCFPNYHTYNTVLSTCEKAGDLEGVTVGFKVAKKFVEEAKKEAMLCKEVGSDEGVDITAQEGAGESRHVPFDAYELESVLPDTYSRSLSKNLLTKAQELFYNGELSEKEFKDSMKPAFLELAEFDKSKFMNPSCDIDDTESSIRPNPARVEV